VGNRVQITSDVKFFTHGGGWVFREKYPDMDTFGKIVIGNNVYVGNNSLILPGVIIGNNVIVGAGSVVTKSIPEGSVVAGNPAKIIGTLDEVEEKMVEKDLKTKGLIPSEKRRFLEAQPEDAFIQKPFLVRK